MFHWCSQSPIRRPTAPQSQQQSVWSYASDVCPLGNAPGRSIECQQVISSAVAVLFCSRRPAAILFRVAKSVVHSLDRVLGTWSKPHVREKHCEVVPGIANANAAAAIVAVLRCGWIAATGAHPLPDNVLRRAVHAVNGAGLATHSTATALATTKITRLNGALVSTVTATMPVDLAAHAGRFAKHCPSAKRLSGQVCEAGVTIGRLRFSHDSTSDTRLVRTAWQLQLPSCSHFSRKCSSGATSTSSSLQKGFLA